MSDIIDNEYLIALIKERPILWDKTLDIYQDRNSTEGAWREVCREIRADFEDLGEEERKSFGKEVMKRWKNIRDAFSKSEKKEKEAKINGPQVKKRRKYIFNDQLQFLKKVYDKAETIESPTIEENKAETGNIEGDESLGAKEKAASSIQSRGKNKKIDDIDLRILRALEKSIPEKPNPHMYFFQSLLSHTHGFDDNEWLQFQIEVLRLISNFKNQRTAALHYQNNVPQFTPQFQQQSQYHPQPQTFPLQQIFPTSTSHQSQPPHVPPPIPLVAAELMHVPSFQTRQNLPPQALNPSYLSPTSILPHNDPSASSSTKNKTKETTPIKIELDCSSRSSSDSSSSADFTF